MPRVKDDMTTNYIALTITDDEPLWAKIARAHADICRELNERIDRDDLSWTPGHRPADGVGFTQCGGAQSSPADTP
jgi:hypothetical protein